MLSSILICLRKFNMWHGQASRSEFKAFFIFYLFMIFLGNVLDTYNGTFIAGYPYFWLIVFLAFFFSPMLAVTARRMQYGGSLITVLLVFLFVSFLFQAALASVAQRVLYAVSSIFFELGPYSWLYTVQVLFIAASKTIPFVLFMLPIAFFCMRERPQNIAEKLTEESMGNEESKGIAQHTNAEGLLQAPALTATHAEKITATASSHVAHNTFCTPYSGKIRHGKDGDLKDAL